MTHFNRREFLKSQLAILSSAGLFGLSSCMQKKPLDSFSVYWLHIEGAPLRGIFDLIIDPFEHQPGISLPVTHKKYSYRFGQYSVPEVWFKGDNPSPLLSHLLTVRGLSSASPHLKQCRGQWFEQESFQKLFKSNDGLQKIEASWFPQTPALGKIFQNLLPFERRANAQDKAYDHHEVFKYWKESSTKPVLRLALLNQYAPDTYFENTSQIDESSLKQHLKFYREIIEGLEGFVDHLKKKKVFDKSLILISSDRARVITNPTDGFPLKTEPMWQGLNISLLSGALKGPQTIGHIYKDHPRYADSYPGTWGAGVENWTPRHVHQLLADLCFPTGYYGQTSWVSKNPWLDRKPLNSFMVKPGPGQVL